MIPQSNSITIRVISDTAGWDAIRSDWDALFSASPQAAPSLDFTWQRTWWDIYGDAYGAGGLRVVTVWRGEGLIGAVGMYRGKGERGKGQEGGEKVFSVQCSVFRKTDGTKPDEKGRGERRTSNGEGVAY